MNIEHGQKELKGCVILLVDDHKDTLDAIRLFLEFRRAECWPRPPDRMDWTW